MTSTRRIKTETSGFELVLNENDLNCNGAKNELELDLQNMICGGNTVLLDGNQYYIHSNEVEAVILNPDEGNDVYVKNDGEEPIHFVENAPNFVYSVGGKRLKLENGKVFNLEQFSDELGILNQVNGKESSVQYAVIKDGQLHLQLNEDDTVEILNENEFKSPCILKKKNPQKNFQYNLIETPPEEIEVIFEPENNSDLGQIDFIKPEDNIQVIFDDDLLKSQQNLSTEEVIPQKDNFLNQKFTIGRKPNGKCLVGRILNIQTPQNQINFNVGDEFSSEMNQNQIDFISKTLNGLAELPTLQKKLLNTNLEVKLIEKFVDNHKKVTKKTTDFHGVLIEYINEGDNEKFYRFNLLTETNLGFTQKSSLIIAVNTTKLEEKEKISTKVTFLDEKVEKSSSIFCGICSKSFKSQNLLLKHASNEHLDQFPVELNPRMVKNDLFFVCFQCTMNFKSISELNEHKKRIHGSGGDKFFYCETCGRQFSRHSNLIRHEVIHNGEGNLYNCTICGSSYKFVSSLTRHIVQNHVGKG